MARPELLGPLAGGNRNVVLRARLRGRDAVVRRSGRSEASLQWESELLEHLTRASVAVPEAIPTEDGDWHVGGWHVQRFIEGRPVTPGDAGSLGSGLVEVHAAAVGWRQRPGSRSAAALLSKDVGGDIDLADMGAGGGNALVLSDGRCALIDWDESRVDDPLFDLAGLPGADPVHPRGPGVGDRHVLARRAGLCPLPPARVPGRACPMIPG